MMMMRKLCLWVGLIALGWSSGASAVPLFVSDPVPTVSFIGDKPILHKDLDSNFQYSATGVDVLYNSESTTHLILSPLG